MTKKKKEKEPKNVEVPDIEATKKEKEPVVEVFDEPEYIALQDLIEPEDLDKLPKGLGPYEIPAGYKDAKITWSNDKKHVTLEADELAKMIFGPTENGGVVQVEVVHKSKNRVEVFEYGVRGLLIFQGVKAI